jgi:hypothetical protein
MVIIFNYNVNFDLYLLILLVNCWKTIEKTNLQLKGSFSIIIIVKLGHPTTIIVEWCGTNVKRLKVSISNLGIEVFFIKWVIHD